VRLLVALVGAIAINLLLFVGMQRMISERELPLAERSAAHIVDFVRLQRDETPPEVEVKRPPPPDRRPPPEPEPTLQPPPPKAAPPEVPAPDLRAPSIRIPLRIAGDPHLGPYIPDPPPPAEPAPEARAAPTAPTAPTPAKAPGIAVDVAPIVRVPPEYPPFAMRARIEGVVTVEFTIARDGSVRDPVVVEAQPPDIFDHAVLRVIGRWRFQPQMVDGVPVEQRARQDVRFRLGAR
jgi:periplasmic protein TonB